MANEFETGNPEQEADWSVPSYMVAANVHNTGNMNPDMFGDASPELSLGTRAGRMITSAAMSGVNSFYNTAVWAGNMFSDKDAQYRDTRDWIASYDEDTAKYYDQNRQAADLLGFVATSFVPGLGGVKVFNAASKALTASREGVIGANMARGFGVLPGARQTLVKEAVDSYATSRKAFSWTDPATMKAIASGFGEQILQAAAFETAVAVTMKKSPILNDASVGDIISHIATGALVGGGIGGVIEGALAKGLINRGIRETDRLLAPVTQDMRGVAGTKASDELLIARNDLDTTPVNVPEGVDPTVWATQLEQKRVRIDNKSREHFTTLADGNAEVGNRLYEGLRTDPTAVYQAKLVNLEGIHTIRDTAKLKKYGLIEGDGLEATHTQQYFKLWGDDMGKLSEELPTALHLADSLPAKSSITVGANKVVAGKTTYNVIPGKYFSSQSASYEEAMARNIWAMDNTVPPLALKKNQEFLPIGENDIPMLTKAYRENFTAYRLVNESGEQLTTTPTSKAQLLEYLSNKKDALAVEDLTNSGGVIGKSELTVEHLANRYDTPVGFLTGEQFSTTVEDAIFGLSKAQKEYYNKFHANTPNPPEISAVKPWLTQQNYRMVYAKAGLDKINNFEVEALTLIKQRQVLQQEANENAVATALGMNARELPELTTAEMERLNRTGAGAGFISFANGGYGTAASKAEYVGQRVTNWIRQAEEKVGMTMQPVNYAIVNDATKTAELAAVLQKIRGAGGNRYVIDGEALKLKALRDYERALEEGAENITPPVIPNGIEPIIPMASAEVRQWVQSHIALNGERVTKLNNLRGAKGQPSNWDPEVFYAPAPNPDRFKFHAFVTDDSKITSDFNTSMLYAQNAKDLEKQAEIARAQGFNVVFPEDTAAYYKARGTYDYTKGLNESQIDTAMRAGGSSTPAFPLTGTPEEMVQDLMQWHAKQEAIVIREAVSTKYSQQFGVMQQMGDEYAKLQNARIGFFNKFRGDVKNPYEDYIKTFLGASLKKDYPLWTALNNAVDEAGSKVYSTVSSLWKNPSKAYNPDEVNKVFADYGIGMAATPAQLEAWVNHPAGQTVIGDFVRKQNSVLASLVLRLDPVNSLNNALGSTILTGAETKSVLNAILTKNPERAGELAQLTRIGLPGVEGDSIVSAAKLIGSAYKNFFSEGSEALLKRYKDIGVVTDTSTQFKNLIEASTIEGTETAAQLASKWTKMQSLANTLVEKGEKWTGNKLAEEMNRFVSANIMDQITGVAIREGIMDQRTANAYINTFVNRTQGNVIASQRPQIFQGAVGQAIGLFQSYQFNIMQQLLRHVGEGSKKDALMLMGMQSTIYGAQGLPAFSAINQHIIGTASGNTNHTDLYSATYGIVGKTAGDWLLYGVSSNLLIDPDLKINLYSRGDINPRQVTVVPSNFQDIAIVNSWGKLLSATKSSLSQVQGGGDIWNSILSGVEQQGINRPLSGLARVARGIGDNSVSYSTTGKGNIVSANDFYSLANLARLSGAKPFDEAVTQDAVYRIQAYQAVDRSRREEIGKAVKSVILAGKNPTSEQMDSFAERYARAGGKQEEFIKWYTQQISSATVPQANKLMQKATPYSEYLQTIMGGRQFATPDSLGAATNTVTPLGQ